MKISMVLSRQDDGKYMLTGTVPDRRYVRGSNREDLYVPGGDDIGFRFICGDLLEKSNIPKLKKFHGVFVTLEILTIGDTFSIQTGKEPEDAEE